MCVPVSLSWKYRVSSGVSAEDLASNGPVSSVCPVACHREDFLGGTACLYSISSEPPWFNGPPTLEPAILPAEPHTYSLRRGCKGGRGQRRESSWRKHRVFKLIPSAENWLLPSPPRKKEITIKMDKSCYETHFLCLKIWEAEENRSIQKI